MNKTKKVVIIDADSLIFLAGNSVQDSRNEALGTAAINNYVYGIFKATQATHYIGFFQSKSFNFRNQIYRDYKANRKDTKKPEWVTFWRPRMKKILKEQWKFTDVSPFNIESDDAVNIAYKKLAPEFDEKDLILAHNDKDLNNIYSDHRDAHLWYNYKTKAWFRVRKERSIYFFWSQCITGDAGDNIKGIIGKGKVFAAKLLDEIQKYPRQMFFAVYREYIKKYPVTFRETFIMNRDCLKLKDNAEGFEVLEPLPVPNLMEKLNVELLNI